MDSSTTKMQLSILLLMFGFAYGVIIHENVVFNKVNEITTTRARWLVAFVQDLSPFKYYLARIRTDIDLAANITDTVIDHYDGPTHDTFRETLANLREEVFSLSNTLSGVLQGYSSYRALGSRSRRALIPGVSSILSFLFGTLSEADIDDVRRGMNDLSKNQQTIMHVLEEQMSILNVSRVQIAENRYAIIDLVKAVNLFDQRFRQLTDMIQQRFQKVEMFMNVYTQMDLLISGIKDALQRAVLYLENLRMELNMLSLDHLSPSTVTPSQLQSLLIQIKLPSTLKLPEDPEKNIWYFYRVLTCSTLLENDKITVVINIPLLDYHGEFEVFRIHSIAVPPNQKFNKSSGLSEMVEKYDVESPGILINKDRSQYALLDSDELQTCGNQVMKYCSPKSAVLPVNLHRLCSLSLFFEDNNKIDRFCRKLIQPNAVLPSAQYIDQGNWIVSARKPLQFSIVCLSSSGRKSSNVQKDQKMTSYVDVISLKSGCHASNDYIKLPPYYEFEGYRVNSLNPLNKLLEVRKQGKFRIWEQFHEALPNFTKLELPEGLQAIEEIPMGDFIRTLEGLNQVRVNTPSLPTWVHIIISMSLLVAMIALVCFCCKHKKGGGARNVCIA